MKFAIVLCVLCTLLVCQETLCIDFPALLEGNCDLSDVPAGALAGCEHITCRKDKNGEIGLAGLGCGLMRCPDGRSNTGPADLTKKYPACCPTLDCTE